VEELFKTRSCTEILTNDIEIYTIYQYVLIKKLQRITQYTYWGLSFKRQEWVYMYDYS